MVSGLRAGGFTNVRPVGFYAGDSGCADYVPDRADNTVNTSITELGRELANLIYTRYTSRQRPVAVSAHSMGGLVIRAALDGVANRQPGFPARLQVTDVVTSSTPHAGTPVVTRCAGRVEQCAQMLPGSGFLTNLGQNPQGVAGTDWTLIGSRRDQSVPARSAVAMRRVSTSRPAIGKVVYPRYTHFELVTEPVPLDRIATGLRTAS
jgi:triacylglycerol esterase/lipase EstA (alpha/beta hydrolase family)